jgi:hypothetical protein
MPGAPAIARAGNVRRLSQNGKANTVRTNHTYCTNPEVPRVLSLLQRNSFRRENDSGALSAR